MTAAELRAAMRPVIVAIETAIDQVASAMEAGAGASIDPDGTILDNLGTAAAALARTLVSPEERAAELLAARTGLAEYEPRLRAALHLVAAHLSSDDRERNAMDRIILTAANATETVLHRDGCEGRAIGDGTFHVLGMRDRDGWPSLSTAGAPEVIQ